MNILIVVPSYPKYSGVDYHRLVMPHNAMSEYCEVSMINEIDTAERSFLEQFDLIVANRFISKTGNYKEVIEKLKGLKWVLDLDDDYRLPDWHLLKGRSQELDHAYQISYSLSRATAVTVTHSVLAETLSAECGSRTYVVPNGITPIGQFEPRLKPEGINLGWQGSITHFEDVLMVHDALFSLYKSHEFKFIYGGYDGTDQTSRAIAGVLSCKGTAPAHKFSFFPAADVVRYAEFYDLINIALIPLRDNRFNNMKSNLKLLEAGFKGCCAVVSDVFPYSPILTDKNCLKVKKKKDWYKQIKRAIENPNLVKDLSEQLYQDVQEFHINKVAKTRFQAYDDIINRPSLG